MNLYLYTSSKPIDLYDPMGLQPQMTPEQCSIYNQLKFKLDNPDKKGTESSVGVNYNLIPVKATGKRQIKTNIQGVFSFLRYLKPNVDTRMTRGGRRICSGCFGVTQGHLGRTRIPTMKQGGDLQYCYKTLGIARSIRDNWNEDDKCCKTCKGPSQNGRKAQVIGVKWQPWTTDKEGNRVKDNKAYHTYDEDGRVQWNELATDSNHMGDIMVHQDWGFYDEQLDAFWHADSDVNSANQAGNPTPFSISDPEHFKDDRHIVYCVVCEGDGKF